MKASLNIRTHADDDFCLQCKGDEDEQRKALRIADNLEKALLNARKRKSAQKVKPSTSTDDKIADTKQELKPNDDAHALGVESFMNRKEQYVDVHKKGKIRTIKLYNIYKNLQCFQGENHIKFIDKVVALGYSLARNQKNLHSLACK